MNHPKSQCCGADVAAISSWFENASEEDQHYCSKCQTSCWADGVRSRPTKPLCGAIIHVGGLEGSTTCAETKPCKFHDENGRLKRLEPLSDLDAFKIRTAPRMSELEARKSASDKEWNYERQKDRDPEISKPSEPPAWEKEFRDRWQGVEEKSYIHKEVIDEMIEFFSKQLAAEYARGRKEEATHYKLFPSNPYADAVKVATQARKDEQERIIGLIESYFKGLIIIPKPQATKTNLIAVIKALDAEPKE